MVGWYSLSSNADIAAVLQQVPRPLIKTVSFDIEAQRLKAAVSAMKREAPGPDGWTPSFSCHRHGGNFPQLSGKSVFSATKFLLYGCAGALACCGRLTGVRGPSPFCHLCGVPARDC